MLWFAQAYFPFGVLILLLYIFPSHAYSEGFFAIVIIVVVERWLSVHQAGRPILQIVPRGWGQCRLWLGREGKICPNGSLYGILQPLLRYVNENKIKCEEDLQGKKGKSCALSRNQMILQTVWMNRAGDREK